LGFEYWATAQPNNNGDERCLAARYDQGLIRTWRDRTCTELMPYVCETPAEVPDGCTAGVIEGKDVAYCTTAAAFADAVLSCESVGGSLIHVTTHAENDTLLTELVTEFAGLGGVTWLGAEDPDADGTWNWLDGTPLFSPVYSPWSGNEPIVSDPALDCAEMRLLTGENGAWGPRDCTDTSAYLCRTDDPDARSIDCLAIDVGNFYYALCSDVPLAFDAARSACQDMAGDLARIDTELQQDTIVDAAVTAVVNARVLIGASDADTEDVWTWTDGTVFDDLR
jgi:hypothetical protein